MSQNVDSPLKQQSLFSPRQDPEIQKKKRSKLNKTGSSSEPTASNYKSKAEPNAPKITPPCTECGRRFWSMKALFGHMRCHPERHWRGINPPPNSHRSLTATTLFTKEDKEVAESLLMLASGLCDGSATSMELGLFECSSCKKVFGSHQALGGHRASHKNVKGCFAIARNYECEGEGALGLQSCNHSDVDGGNVEGGNYHQCSICLKVFSSGQALGGHKRRHWEKDDQLEYPLSSTSTQGLVLMNNSYNTTREGCWSWDLNLPASRETGDDKGSSSSSSDLDLGLSLGI